MKCYKQLGIILAGGVLAVGDQRDVGVFFRQK